MADKRICYVIHPYRARGFWNKPVLKWLKIAWNIYRARDVAKVFWKRGYVVLCCSLNSAFMDGVCEDKVFLEGDLQLLRLCNSVVVCKGWKDSTGCVEEVNQARELKKDIIFYYR
jgi:hypothetical protein